MRGLRVVCLLGTVSGLTTIAPLLVRASTLQATSGKPCPKCGCTVGHCRSGVPGHLKCELATPEEKAAIEQRKRVMEQAISAVKSGFTIDNCNQALGRLADQLGYKGFNLSPSGGFSQPQYMKADAIHDFLFSPRAGADGWAKVRGEEITQHADVGNLVVGVIHSKNYPRDGKGPFVYPLDPAITRDNGHVFVVRSGSTWDSSYDWKNLNVWQAQMGSGKGIHEIPASQSIRRDARSFVQFYSYTGRYGAESGQ